MEAAGLSLTSLLRAQARARLMAALLAAATAVTPLPAARPWQLHILQVQWVCCGARGRVSGTRSRRVATPWITQRFLFLLPSAAQRARQITCMAGAGWISLTL